MDGDKTDDILAVVNAHASYREFAIDFHRSISLEVTL